MLKYLKISASALALSALVIAPATTFVTADYAYAKSENAGGKGNGGGKGNSGNKGGKVDKGGNGAKSAKGGNSGKKGGGNFKSATRGFKNDMKSFGNAFKSDVGALFGKKSKPSKQAAAKAPAAAKGNKIAKADPLHPSNLGKMNGFLNSSPNAKLAHIANGQYLKGTGPVSLAAALAVANYQVTAVEAAVATQTAAEAYAALAAFDDTQIAASADLYSTYDLDGDGVFSEDERLAMEEAEVEAADIETAEAVKSAQDGLIDPETNEAYAEPTEEEIAEAEKTLSGFEDGVDPLEAAQAAATDAEAAALAIYKGDFDALTEEEQAAVREAMLGALPTDTEIADALAKANAEDDELLEDETAGDDSASADDELVVEEDVVNEG